MFQNVEAARPEDTVPFWRAIVDMFRTFCLAPTEDVRVAFDRLGDW